MRPRPTSRLFYCLFLASLAFMGSLAHAPENSTASFTFEQLAKPTFALKELVRMEGNGYMAPYEENVAVASDGTVLLLDTWASKIRVFDPRGAFVGHLGGNGRGPGEFVGVRALSLYENDSLLVTDPQMLRVSVFARSGPNWRFVRSFPYKSATADGYTVWSFHRAVGLDGYLVHHIVPNMSGAHQKEAKVPVVRLMDEAGRVKNASFAKLRPMEEIVERTANSVSVTDKPFPRKSIIRFGKNGEHYTASWTEHLRIVKRNAQGDSIGGLSVEIVPRKVLPAHAAFSATAGMPGMARNLPETHPAFTDFWVSEKGNYWVNLGQLDQRSQVWAVFSPRGVHLGSALAPANRSIQAIRGGKLYAQTDRNDENSGLVAYEAGW